MSAQRAIKLGKKLAHKVAQQMESQQDVASAVADAFFDGTTKGKSEADFQRYLLTGTSKFSQALPSTVKKCVIGAMVDAKSKIARFMISATPSISQAVLNNLVLALNTDYQAFYGAFPNQRLADKLSSNLVRPATLQGSNPSIIIIT